MLQRGDPAPDFALPGTSAEATDEQVSQYRLADALEAGPVLLNFYLFDFHPACTEHMCDLHDLAWVDLDDSVTVFGISTDRSFSHQAFAAEEQLSVALLSDSDGSIAESYDVLFEEFQGHKRIAKRSVFLVDTDGTIRYAWATDEPSEQPNWQEVKEALDSLRENTSITE